MLLCRRVLRVWRYLVSAFSVVAVPGSASLRACIPVAQRYCRRSTRVRAQPGSCHSYLGVGQCARGELAFRILDLIWATV
eukprot:4494824-Pyramimonas_sp.AAC.1